MLVTNTIFTEYTHTQFRQRQCKHIRLPKTYRYYIEAKAVQHPVFIYRPDSQMANVGWWYTSAWKCIECWRNVWGLFSSLHNMPNILKQCSPILGHIQQTSLSLSRFENSKISLNWYNTSTTNKQPIRCARVKTTAPKQEGQTFHCVAEKLVSSVIGIETHKQELRSCILSTGISDTGLEMAWQKKIKN